MASLSLINHVRAYGEFISVLCIFSHFHLHLKRA